MCIKNKKKITSRLWELKGDMGTAAFARKCGIKQPVMDRYLRNGYEPKIDQMILICNANHCSLDWLVGLSDTKLTTSITTLHTVPESEWEKRARVAEDTLNALDVFIDDIVNGTNQTTRGLNGVRKVLSRKRG